jgi:hypothetical protein
MGRTPCSQETFTAQAEQVPHSVRRPGGHVTQVLEKCGTTCSLETWSSCCTGRRQEKGLNAVRRLGAHVAQVGDKEGYMQSGELELMLHR